jgi:hypothetical protein
MRVRTSPFVVTLVAGALTGTMALTTSTALASSHHGNGSSTKNVTVKGNCNAVGSNNNVHCVTISHRHGHGGNGDFGHHRGDPGLGHGLEDVVSGVGDVLGGLLGGL